MPKLKQNEIHTITKIVTSENNEKTFSYSKELQDEELGHAVFILLYPTRNVENFYVEDSTSNHLLNHMKELGLSSYTVVNLFGMVTKSRLSTRGLMVDEENLIYLKEQVFSKINESTKVVIAWGNSHLTSYAVNQSKKRLLELWEELHQGKPLYQLTADGLERDCVGVHPLYLGIRHSNSVWRIEKYPVQKELSKLSKAAEEKKPGKQEKKSKQPGRKTKTVKE